jgi:hypothetical protein
MTHETLWVRQAINHAVQLFRESIVFYAGKRLEAE